MHERVNVVSIVLNMFEVFKKHLNPILAQYSISIPPEIFRKQKVS